MSLPSIRAEPCVTNQCASYFCSCQPLGVLLMTPAIWRIRPYWPYDESPDGLSFLIPCGSKWVIGIPTRVIPVETTVATTVKFRPLFAILVNFIRIFIHTYTQCICICAVRGYWSGLTCETNGKPWPSRIGACRGAGYHSSSPILQLPTARGGF